MVVTKEERQTDKAGLRKYGCTSTSSRGGKMGYRNALKLFCVPQTTLKGKVKQARDRIWLVTYETVFSNTQENELVKHLLHLFGFTLTDLRSLLVCFGLAEKNGIFHVFNNKNKMDGKEWLYGLLKWYPRLSLRGPGKHRWHGQRASIA